MLLISLSCLFGGLFLKGVKDSFTDLSYGLFYFIICLYSLLFYSS